MKSNFIKVTSLVISFSLMFSAFVGCKKSDNSSEANNQTASTNDSKQTGGLPIVKDPITIKVWAPLQANQISIGLTSFSQIESFKELEKRTNIKVEWTNPSNQNVTEVFKLMIASGDLPDAFLWLTQNLERAKLVSDGAVEKLNALIDKAPNLKKVIDTVPNLRKNLVDDENNIFYIPSYLPEGSDNNIYNRIHIRKDWLEKVGLKEPQTQEELYKVLKAFKETDLNNNGKKDEIPLSVNSNKVNGYLAQFIFWPLGIVNDFYQVNGKIKYGALEPEFKQSLQFGNKIYSEGLIDADFVTQNLQKVEQKVSSNLVGVSTARMQVRCNQIRNNLKNTVPDYNMWVIPFLKGNDGKKYAFMGMPETQPIANYGLYLSPNSKFKTEVMKWIDYQFTEEGGYLMNYGVEGVSRVTVNGVPQLNADMLKDEKGNLNIANSCKYTAFGAGWPSFMPKEGKVNGKWPLTSTLAVGDEKLYEDAIKVFEGTDISHMLPQGISFTEKEQAIITEKMNTISAFVDEKSLKIISGAEPVSKFDQYVEEIKKMGIEDVIKVYQQALDRYNMRK